MDWQSMMDGYDGTWTKALSAMFKKKKATNPGDEPAAKGMADDISEDAAKSFSIASGQPQKSDGDSDTKEPDDDTDDMTPEEKAQTLAALAKYLKE